MFDYNKLRGKIREVFGTQERFAAAINLSNTSVSQKLNNKVEWSQDEIHKSVEVLKIPKEEISAYFFDSVVQEIEPEIQEGDKTSTNGISGKV